MTAHTFDLKVQNALLKGSKLWFKVCFNEKTKGSLSTVDILFKLVIAARSKCVSINADHNQEQGKESAMPSLISESTLPENNTIKSRSSSNVEHSNLAHLQNNQE